MTRRELCVGRVAVRSTHRASATLAWQPTEASTTRRNPVTLFLGLLTAIMFDAAFDPAVAGFQASDSAWRSIQAGKLTDGGGEAAPQPPFRIDSAKWVRAPRER